MIPPGIVHGYGQRLLDTELWALGQDARYSQGNLLVAYGGVRVRGYSRPEDNPNHSKTQYEFWSALGTLGDVFVWSFGVWFGTPDEGIWISRSHMTPNKTTGDVELHDTADRPRCVGQSDNRSLLLAGLRWFADYERWIQSTTPLEHQRARQCSFPRRSLQLEGVVALAACWDNLIQEVQTSWKQLYRYN